MTWRRSVKALTKSQQRKTREIGESIYAHELHWKIFQWQLEMTRSKEELRAIEAKLARLARAALSQASACRALRRQRDTRNRRRKLLILWIVTATARIEALGKGD